jgi:hypothetical protein
LFGFHILGYAFLVFVLYVDVNQNHLKESCF